MADLMEWPEWMPKPLQDGFSMQPVDNRTISQMEKGTAIRVEFDSDEMEATCTLELNQIQAGWFARFWKDALFHGSRWFSFPLWVDGEIQWQPVRFKSLPTNSRVNALWTRYQFTLQVEKRDLLSDTLFWLLGIFSPQGIVSFGNAVHQAVHFDVRGSTLVNVPAATHAIIHQNGFCVAERPHDVPWPVV